MMKKSVALLVFVFWNFCLFSQDVKNIQLKNEKTAYPLKNYYIVRIKDDRADTSNIGAVKTGLLSKKNQLINLENGAGNAFAQFIRNNVHQDSSASPIVLHITKLNVQETGSSGLKTENELTIALAFYTDTIKLIEYTAGGSTQSTNDPTKLIEELIRGNLASLLYQFDEWWSANKKFYTTQKTKPTIKVEASIEEEPDNPDMISYSLSRPLTLDDFQGKPDESINAAALSYSMVLLKYSSAMTMNNEIFVDVYVLTNFSKSKSWCRMENRNAETLNHEQRHFDISAIKACELLDTIRKFTFSVDHFPAELEKLRRQKQKELEQMQEQYDGETKHGMGPQTQENWNKMIRQKLQNIDCFHS